MSLCNIFAMQAIFYQKICGYKKETWMPPAYTANLVANTV